VEGGLPSGEGWFVAFGRWTGRFEERTFGFRFDHTGLEDSPSGEDWPDVFGRTVDRVGGRTFGFTVGGTARGRVRSTPTGVNASLIGGFLSLWEEVAGRRAEL
jgi:hypothetical protein